MEGGSSEPPEPSLDPPLDEAQSTALVASRDLDSVVIGLLLPL